MNDLRRGTSLFNNRLGNTGIIKSQNIYTYPILVSHLLSLALHVSWTSLLLFLVFSSAFLPLLEARMLFSLMQGIVLHQRIHLLCPVACKNIIYIYIHIFTFGVWNMVRAKIYIKKK